MKTFIEFAHDYGLIIDIVIEDGKIHRVPVKDGKRGSKDGAYVFFNDECGRAGWVINHRTSEYATYGEGNEKLRSNFSEQKQKLKQKEAERNLKLQYNNVASKIQFLMMVFHDANNNHKYLIRKGVKAHGIKIDNSGALIIPLKNIKGQIRTFQKIFPDGNKVFVKDGEKSGNFFSFGNIDKARTIIICEGFATGASIYESTNIPTVSAMDISNLPKVAQLICSKYIQWSCQ
jgi:phage/plasmid primase-like uncharacterized protein